MGVRSVVLSWSPQHDVMTIEFEHSPRLRRCSLLNHCRDGGNPWAGEGEKLKRYFII